jgi:hypothetical protein
LNGHAYLRRADGDIDLSTLDYSKFNVPSCSHCGVGVLKPGNFKIRRNDNE